MQDAMLVEKPARKEQAAEENLFGVLIAISVAARRPPERKDMKGDKHEQNE